MPTHTLINSKIHFRQSVLPRQWMSVFGELGIYVEITGSRRYPYAVALSESEFLSCIDLAKEM